MPSLSRTVRADRVAEGFFIAVDEPDLGAQISRAHDPLEARQGFGVGRAGRRGDAGQHRGRHDRGRDERLLLRVAGGRRHRARAGTRRAARRPGRRSASASRRAPASSGTATASRSPSGSLASTSSAPDRRACASARSSAPGSSGLGKATVRKSGSGSNLGLDDVRRREAGLLERAQREVAGHAVQRGVGEPQPGRALGRGRDRADRVQVGGGDLVAEPGDQRVVLRRDRHLATAGRAT